MEKLDTIDKVVRHPQSMDHSKNNIRLNQYIPFLPPPFQNLLTGEKLRFNMNLVETLYPLIC